MILDLFRGFALATSLVALGVSVAVLVVSRRTARQIRDLARLLGAHDDGGDARHPRPNSTEHIQ